MASTREFYRYTIEVEVLSEEAFDFRSIHQVANAVTHESCSGKWSVTRSEVVDGPTMARLLQEQASAPEFFQLDEKGNDLEEEFIEVEYDESYSGGDYSDVGDMAYIPASLVEKSGMEQAFRQITGIDPIHIIHWCEGETITRADILSMGGEV